MYCKQLIERNCNKYVLLGLVDIRIKDFVQNC